MKKLSCSPSLSHGLRAAPRVINQRRRQKKVHRQRNQDADSRQVLVARSCPTRCNPMDCSPPGSSVHGILQARILKWQPVPSPGDLPDPGIEPGLPHGRQILYHLSHLVASTEGSPAFVRGSERLEGMWEVAPGSAASDMKVTRELIPSRGAGTLLAVVSLIVSYFRHSINTLLVNTW